MKRCTPELDASRGDCTQRSAMRVEVGLGFGDRPTEDRAIAVMDLVELQMV